MIPPLLLACRCIINTCWVEFFYFLFLFYFLTIQYCIGFAIYQSESTTGIYVFPMLNPPLSSLPMLSWILIEHDLSEIYLKSISIGTPYSCMENLMDGEACWAAVHGVAKSRTRLSDFTLTFHFHALEKEMATHSSVLAWRIPGTGEPGGLPSVESHRVRHDWSDLAAAAWSPESGIILYNLCDLCWFKWSLLNCSMNQISSKIIVLLL